MTGVLPSGLKTLLSKDPYLPGQIRNRGTRQAAITFLVIGGIGTSVDFPYWLSGTAGHAFPLLLDIVNLITGIVVWGTPWARLPRYAYLTLPMFACADIAINAGTHSLPVATLGVWYVLIFVWVGVYGTYRAVLICGPVTTVSYLAPLYLVTKPAWPASTASSAVFTIPIAMLVGLFFAHKNTAELAKQAADERFGAIFDSAPLALFACDTSGRVVFSQANKQVEDIALHPWKPPEGQCPDQAVIGRSVYEIFQDNPERIGRLQRAISGEKFSSEVQISSRFLDVHYRPIYRAGVLNGAMSVAFDATERVESQIQQRRLEAKALDDTIRQALTDELTGLMNRRGLYQHLDRMLTQGRNHGRFSLLLLDLDHFKEVNDSMGHTEGDRLLQQVAVRLGGTLQAEGHLVARLGGDEFAIVLDSDSPDQAIETTQNILRLFDRPFDLGDIVVHVTVSVGMALYPTHAASRSELMRCADVAMYTAKRDRSGLAVYDRESDRNGKDRLIAIEQLREALQLHQLTCYFQPKIAIGTGRVVGAEALVRWDHPSRGLLAPTEFVSLAEQTGMMPALSRCVLENALAQCHTWRQAGHPITVAVNLSVSDLLDITLADTIRNVLTTYQLDASCLVLEITENAIMTNPQRVATVAAQLQNLGVSISIDDYGTGYSTLSYLRDLPVHELKLDRTFVTGISARPKDQAIIQATVLLARTLGLQTVAEGVETTQDWEYLRDCGADVAQGYAISRPLPADQFASWLAAHSTKPVELAASTTPQPDAPAAHQMVGQI
jgi:diguanylate cyclase (GGDEF)-like protein